MACNHHAGIALFHRGMGPRGDAVADTSRVLRALDLQSKAIELYPSLANAWSSRGAGHLALGREDLAMRDWEKALALVPNIAEAQCGVGFLLARQGRVEEGEAHLRLAVKQFPRYVQAYRNLGITLAMQRRLPEAIVQWKKGLEHEASNVTLMFLIGAAYRDLGNDEESRKWLDRAKDFGAVVEEEQDARQP